MSNFRTDRCQRCQKQTRQEYTTIGHGSKKYGGIMHIIMPGINQAYFATRAAKHAWMCTKCGYPTENTGCYIASASLQGAISLEELEPLKAWRYSTLEKWRFGNYLSNYYRKTAVPIADKVEKMPKLASILRSLLIIPAIKLAKKDSSFIRDGLLFILFITGLVIAKVIDKITLGSKNSLS